MPPSKKPPRLWLRKREGRPDAYFILDAGKQYATGCGGDDSEGAEKALATHIARKWQSVRPQGAESDMTIAAVLTIYGEEHAPTVADPARIGYAITALLPFWGEKMVSTIKGETCRRYVKSRGGNPRRELETLRAALRYCEKEGYLVRAPVVWLPEKPPSRERHLTRDEAARLLWTAYRGYRSKHLARFMLIALYTGTRREAVLALEWTPSMSGGHVDMENGLIYRQSAGARRTKKRQTPVRIPRRLRLHLERWKKEGTRWVIEYRGERCLNVKKAWASARIAAGLGSEVVPHVLRHTAITWAMQSGATIEDVSSFFAVDIETIQRTYWHHSPYAQNSVIDAIDGRKG